MFQTVHNIVSSITDLAIDNEFSDKHKHFIERMPYKQFDNVFQMITNQKPIKNIAYSIYKMDYETMDFEFVAYDLSDIDTDNTYHTVIDISDKHLLLNTLTPACLAEYINDNENNETLFLTFNYYCSAKKEAHQSCIHINTKSKKIYLIDPNGSPDYFNNIFDIDLSFLVEKMLHNYFLELNMLNYNFKYEFIGSWNNKRLAINTNFKETYIGSGHCVVLTFILAHVISILKCHPLDAYIMLKELSEEELLYIIKDYTSAIFNLFSS